MAVSKPINLMVIPLYGELKISTFILYIYFSFLFFYFIFILTERENLLIAEGEPLPTAEEDQLAVSPCTRGIFKLEILSLCDTECFILITCFMCENSESIIINFVLGESLGLGGGTCRYL